MRINVVSDVHGAADSLGRAMQGADALICLGDFVLFLDYDHHEQGIFVELFGIESTDHFIDLRNAGRFDEARAFGNSLWAGIEGDRRSVLDGKVREQYASLCAAMPTPTYLTFGNVDVPHLLREFLRPGQNLFDGEVAEIGGLRVGFVGGGLHSAARTPYELSEDEYDEKLRVLGEVDVLCTHIPPAVPELCYDVVSRRFERGSVSLRRFINETQPRVSVFGHVHQPLARRVRLGHTECVNVGHFRATSSPFVLEW